MYIQVVGFCYYKKKKENVCEKAWKYIFLNFEGK